MGAQGKSFGSHRTAPSKWSGAKSTGSIKEPGAVPLGSASDLDMKSADMTSASNLPRLSDDLHNRIHAEIAAGCIVR